MGGPGGAPAMEKFFDPDDKRIDHPIAEDFIKQLTELSELTSEQIEVAIKQSFKQLHLFEVALKTKQIEASFRSALHQVKRTGESNNRIRLLLKQYPWLNYSFPERLTTLEFLVIAKNKSQLLSKHRFHSIKQKVKDKMSSILLPARSTREEILLKESAHFAKHFFHSIGIDIDSTGMLKDKGGSVQNFEHRYYGLGCELIVKYFLNYDPAFLKDFGNKMPSTVFHSLKS